MKKAFLLPLFLLTSQCYANGMLPETSVLLIDGKKGEATMNVTNTDKYPALLYTKIVDLPDSDKSVHVIVSQPVVRVEGGQVQKMRFMLQADKPLMHEELKRVTFEGIPPKEKDKEEVKVTIRQDMPVIIHPAGLAEDLSPWKHLVWRKKGNQIEVSNPSNYVVRLVASYTTLPSGKGGALPQAYILPHKSVVVKLPSSSDTKVEFYPASRYGYKGERYTTTLE